MKRRRTSRFAAPYGQDSAGNFGRRHRNKYSEVPLSPRLWCNAPSGDRQYCQLVADHAGAHQFAPGVRR